MTRARDTTPVAAGAILPHAPLFSPGVAGARHEHELEPIRSAARTIDLDGIDVVVVLSPHGRVDGVYAQSRADLVGFGVPDTEIRWSTDASFAEDLATAWDVDVLADPVDHGVAVPISVIEAGVPAVGACLADGSDATRDRALGFAAALAETGGRRRVAFVASVNTSAGLSPRAPLTELPGARKLEARLDAALEVDAGRLDGLVGELESTGGSCGAGPLVAFGTLFAGRSVDVMAHAWPVGVGYLVASVRT